MQWLSSFTASLLCETLSKALAKSKKATSTQSPVSMHPVTLSRNVKRLVRTENCKRWRFFVDPVGGVCGIAVCRFFLTLFLVISILYRPTVLAFTFAKPYSCYNFHSL